MVSRRVSAYRALASDKRVSMLHALQRSDVPLGVDELAAAVGLHVNTAREHLERLIDSGFVASEPELRTTRGRPRILYSAVERIAPATTDGWARDQLMRVLVAGYGRRLPSAAGAAQDAGSVWGRSLTPTRPDAPERRGQRAAAVGVVDPAAPCADEVCADPDGPVARRRSVIFPRARMTRRSLDAVTTNGPQRWCGEIVSNGSGTDTRYGVGGELGQTSGADAVRPPELEKKYVFAIRPW